MKRFIILFQGRTGSTFITTKLRTLRDVRISGEGLANIKRSGKPSNIRIINQNAWVENQLFSPQSYYIKAVGFKTKLGDYVDKMHLQKMINKDVLIIYSYRRNLVKLAVSSINARRRVKETNRWNSFKGDQPLPPMEIPLHVFESHLKRKTKGVKRIDEYISKLKCPIYSIAYEDLLVNPIEEFTKLCQFIGVKFVDNPIGVTKNTSDDLRKVILNFDELRTHYVGTYLEPMFDEVLVKG